MSAPRLKRRVDNDVARTFLRWTFLRAVFHRGYVLASSLYFVIDAHLTASQLVALGTVMAVTLLLSDIPAGAWSDAFSRKWPLVIGHAFLAAGMTMTGLVTAFPALVVTQVLWGLGWAFSGGADVAWVTDELNRPDRIARVLTARARFDLLGGATGLVMFGLVGWAAGLAWAIVTSGVAMALLGLFVTSRFPEDHFKPEHADRLRASLALVQRGASIARRDHEIRLVLAATLLINAADMVGWLFPKRLVDLGFPNNPVLWYTALGIIASAFGVVALHIVEARIHGIGVARKVYALGCAIGLAGLVVLAYAPDTLVGGAGIVLASGIAFNVTRAVSVIWVNRRTATEVRATVHSFLSQAESVGEIIGGFALAALARAGGMSTTLVVSGVVVGFAGVLVLSSRGDRAAAPVNDT
jgi:predicted MFS family arabinose efflux permease